MPIGMNTFAKHCVCTLDCGETTSTGERAGSGEEQSTSGEYQSAGGEGEGEEEGPIRELATHAEKPAEQPP
jgi:hypothetical protein